MAQLAQAARTPSRDDSAASPAAPHGRAWRSLPAGRAGRGAWLVLALLELAVFVPSLRAYARQLATLCPDPAGAGCAWPQATLAMQQALERVGLDVGAYAAYTFALHAGISVAFWAAGLLVFWCRRDGYGLAVSLFLVSFGTGGVSGVLAEALVWAHPRLGPVAGPLSGLLFPALGAFLVTFPDGRFVPRWSWVIVGLWAVQLAFWESISGWPAPLFAGELLLVWGSTLAVQVYRYRRVADAAQRQQTKLVVYGLGLSVASIVLTLLAAALLPGFAAPDAAYPLLESTWVALVFGPLPVTVSAAVLRFRLWGVDPLINRTLVYAALTAAVVGLYAAVVGSLGAALRGGEGLVPVAATGLIAVLFQPLRARLQRAVDRLMYGERPDPHAQIGRLGRRLEETSADLQRARERLVAAREEERRRLRRDLHDGLGPALAGMSLKAGAARNLVRRDPASADALLGELTGEIQLAVTDVRRLVDGMRPPAIDELGLTGAIRACARRFRAPDGSPAGSLTVRVHAPESLPTLPAATEVAAYRIAEEALANVLRHARASACDVRVRLDAGASFLELEIIDDGVGLHGRIPIGEASLHGAQPGTPASPGVGHVSMRERAAELGGSCAVGPAPGGGTRVLARLPLDAGE